MVETYYVQSMAVQLKKISLHDYVWNKISEMIEHDVLNDPDEELEIADEDKINLNSQLAFWISMLQRYNATGQIQNFKYFFCFLAFGYSCSYART